MQFVVDENVPRPVLDRLRMSGYDVLSIQETMSGISDPEVLKVARSQNRILITADQDFGELTVRHRLGVNGVIIIQLGRLSNAARADRVAEVVAVHVDRLAGHLVVVEPTRVRIRPLPPAN
jgi:predicted nuclease of predicted toxin-antitoxin system